MDICSSPTFKTICSHALINGVELCLNYGANALSFVDLTIYHVTRIILDSITSHILPSHQGLFGRVVSIAVALFVTASVCGSFLPITSAVRAFTVASSIFLAGAFFSSVAGHRASAAFFLRPLHAI